MKRRFKIFSLAVLCSLLCVTGCGKTPAGSKSETPKEPGDGTEATNGEQVPTVTVVAGSGSPYRVEQTIPLEIEDPDEEFVSKTLYSGSYGSTLYLLASYQFEYGAEPTMWIYFFDMKTRETEKTPFFLETPGMENPHVYSMTVTDRDELTFRLNGSLEGKTASNYLFRSDLTGKALDEEMPFSEDNGYPPETGRFFALPDGSPILSEAGESMSSSLYRYDTQSQRPVPLATVTGIVTALCSDGQGGLYYANSDQLRHLNLDDMTDELLGRTAEYGIKPAMENWLLRDGDGKLAFCSINVDHPTVYLLTDQEESHGETASVEREEIRFACLYLQNNIFHLADVWSAQSDKYRIVREEIETNAILMSDFLRELEPIRTRIMAELVAGQGPELMYVSEDDMHILAEKGALLDLSELIPEEIQEQLLPGIRQLGTVDGKWVGVTSDVFYYTFMTSDSLWSKDSWTVSEMLDLAESKNDWGDWILSFIWLKPDYNNLFDWGFSRSLGDSPFMDLKNGISYFNGEEFIRALEFCKKYGQPSNAKVESDEELLSMLREGKSMAQMAYIYSGLHSFSNVMAAFEDCHIVGFPSEKGSGNYMYADGYLVVNADAEHVDAIKDYISYILDYDVQFGSHSPVRKDVIRDQVGDDPAIYRTPYTLSPSPLHDGYDPWPLEALKPDGTTYLEEFLEFAENCEPVPYCPDAISDIVLEEIDAYFTGNRSAKDTADIIHRRVQLYFDER